MPILFYSKSPEYGWLSNFSPHPFTLDDRRWPSVEHYYQARKLIDPAEGEHIRLADSAGKAKKMGGNRSLAIQPDWDTARVEVMRRALEAKFTQNRRLREQLLATGDEELVHQSRSDRFWGRNAEGVGENRLGIMLVELRQAWRDAA